MFDKFKRRIGKLFLGTSLPVAGLWSWLVPGSWKRGDLLKQYARYVYVAVSAIAEDAAKVEFEINKVNASGIKIPVRNHPFLEFIKKPNSDQSQFQFLEFHFTYLKQTGESFWYLPKGENSKKPKEAYLLRPDLVDVAVDKKDSRGLVSGYILTKPDGTRVPFEKDEVLHFKMPNPLNPYRGLGPVEAGKIYIETEEYASSFTRNSIFNSGRPSGILNFRGLTDKEQFEQVKRQFKKEYSGTKNAGKTLLVRGSDGLDYQKLGMELGEISLKELKDMTRDDIMIMFRVSKTILGITDDVNRANAHESRAVFTENVIKPELDRFVDHLNAFLIPVWGKEYELNYRNPTLVSDKEKLDMYIAGINKWLTTNDIREELGKDPLEGGDKIWLPINLLPAMSASKKALMKRLKKKDLSRKVRAEVFRQILFNNQEVWERRYKKEVVKEFETQKKEIFKNNKSVAKQLDEWLFSIVASKQRLLGSLIPLGLELIVEQSKPALDMAGDDETEFIINERTKSYVTERVDMLADKTNDETIKKITDTISEGIKEGESIGKLKNRITEVYDQATSVRAERIARSETIAASNEAALEAYRQSPVVNAKEWNAEPDACEMCLALDGKVMGLEESFYKSGETATGVDGGKLQIDYGDIEHPPLHPNCRCALLPVA